MPILTAAEVLPGHWTRGEISVVGLARSGRAVAELLARAGATVYASDAGSGDAVDHAARGLEPLGVTVHKGSHDLARIARSALVVVSPGVPPDAPPLRAAREAGVAIVSELEIALQFLPGQRYITVTGTNGKTTTTALIHRLLEGLGYDSVAAGNIGTPLAEVALREKQPDWIALETSSFQLHDTPGIAPSAGVLTNLSANHLDRYESVEEYYGDKALMFQNATPRSVWVSNADDPDSQAMVAKIDGHHLRFTTGPGIADGYYDRGRDLLVALGAPLIARRELVLLGDHNVANALAAALAVMGADESHRLDDARGRISEALRTFRALEHRIEPAGDYAGVEWINDSKSTNVASTLVALRGMTRPTVLLLGGRHKGEPYTALADELRRTGRTVIAYGESAPIVESDLDGVVPVERLGSSFDDVLARARELARPGDAVLLSPACSSYDMFDNYEQRGREFKRIARQLGGGTS
ncbi:MAG TPA: UDP-N-acetylmuramoyl-L-alanine--D-glutamate ligase [Gemmatimonadaceae bacterium]|nr:UDP-N-acetylmuramoyl-L-alanine--D-glutamate ligase [Gemmatimonadaceae bacterium]